MTQKISLKIIVTLVIISVLIGLCRYLLTMGIRGVRFKDPILESD